MELCVWQNPWWLNSVSMDPSVSLLYRMIFNARRLFSHSLTESVLFSRVLTENPILRNRSKSMIWKLIPAQYTERKLKAYNAYLEICAYSNDLNCFNEKGGMFDLFLKSDVKVIRSDFFPQASPADHIGCCSNNVGVSNYVQYTGDAVSQHRSMRK